MRARIVGLLLLTGGIAQAADIPPGLKCRPACEKPGKGSAKLCFGPASDGGRESALVVDDALFTGTADASATMFTSDDGRIQATISLDASGKPVRIEVNGAAYERCPGGFGEGSVTVHN